MPELSSFDYAIVRVVPRVERGEYLNVGVILFARTRNFIDARFALDRERLCVVEPEIDPDEVEQHLEMMLKVVRGGPHSGPIGQLSAFRALQLASLAPQHRDSDIRGSLGPVSRLSDHARAPAARLRARRVRITSAAWANSVAGACDRPASRRSPR